MTDPSSTQHRLNRARSYPYAIPRSSFVYRDGETGPFDPALTRDRTAVLAIGSNQSPERLTQKFGHDARHEIPVQRAVLPGFDVVYSAHIARYGAVPAMLQACRGARVHIAVTWLDDDQLEIMHATEIAAANYHFASLDGARVELDDGSSVEAMAYVSSRGHLQHEGSPLALTAVTCESRSYPAITTDEALERVRERVAGHASADEFVLRLVDDDGYRSTVIETISRDAGPFSHPVTILRSAGS